MSKKGRGRGVAARQAQLRNRKNKGKVRHQNFDPGPSATVSNVTETDIGPAVAAVSVEDKGLSAKRDSGHSRNRRNVKSTKEVALSYDYLGIELRQIGILTALIGVVLAVLTIFLG